MGESKGSPLRDLVDGRIVVRGRGKVWHNSVRDGLRGDLDAAATEPYKVVGVQCVRGDEQNTATPDVTVFDPRELDFFEAAWVPVGKVALVVEVVSPVSRHTGYAP
ncbi:hypothetical protein SAMN06272735_6429 [Streptomyces sp. TLI_55]|nr:hypothetical protein SAMN06272735_6429 [Streptomyces sp. TLI_55]